MARAKVGLTKKQMALELGVTRPTYDDYENYNTIMRIDVAQRFCDIVGVSIDDVIFQKKTTLEV
ncbi:helix-turn-helix transcriptional regulator [Streptococcus suis]|uniref:Helix-turn-helix transcriptional regulator n=2 Tax=Streptococcus suis TaxID=1307 RepID=A0A7T1LC96_STRSU|nr:helix-turn-helix transcriptional regulator [Streptococcus suis]HEM3179482.1 helix-turn-helix transcriptional regulator [Streptococcus suis 92-4172]MBM6460319.1 helix-turn-helix transcriptional regulator [Streptococcus suis]MCB2892293.1 helix-turn-helix transcriptional regulator [Streptococcus suis]MCK3876733.1 helix-turn-helix transcriptional regulator [Streptococcus suis]MCK3879008.1 helix-turn-helix transcriptional regulator [Streptococcus suis]